MASIQTQVPTHIGFIMDGNGRWAKNLGKPRTFGHTEGLKTAKRIIKKATEMGVSYITLYAFSTENWKRTQDEVGFLMQLIYKHLRNEMKFYQENGIRVKLAGDASGLPKEIQKELTDVIQSTSHFNQMTVALAINYGGRDEIVRAISKAQLAGEKEITEKVLSTFLDNPEMPDPDLIVRTAGEQRLSNFLTWQSAYSEFYYSEKLWPEFSDDDLEAAIYAYQNRTRKFGGIL